MLDYLLISGNESNVVLSLFQDRSSFALFLKDALSQIYTITLKNSSPFGHKFILIIYQLASGRDNQYLSPLDICLKEKGINRIIVLLRIIRT